MKTIKPVLMIILVLALTILSACSSLSLDEPITINSQLEQNNQETEVLPVNFAAPPQTTSVVDLQTALIDVYQIANPAVVYIITANSSGSGFVFDTQGHIVTNNHVVAGFKSFEVVFAGGERLEASLVGADPDSDLAVIQVAALPQDVVPLLLGNFNSIQVGQIVVAIGNPFGEQGSMSMGIISGVGRSLPSQRSLNTRSTYTLPEVIQTDAPINPGNSGGPLLNLDGEVIGVNSAIASDTGANSGVGFSIPVSAIQRIVPSLIEKGEYIYSYMGIGFDNEVSLDELAIYNLPQTQGAYVLNVTAGGPADQASLIPANPSTGQGGDLIIAVDGYPVTNFDDLNSYLVFHSSPGQTIELTILRDGDQISRLLTLGSRP